MTGTILGCSNTSKPPTLSISITGTVQEVLLELDGPMAKCPEPGAVVEFDGTPTSFAKDPPILTVSAKRKGVTVQPGTPAAK